MLGNCLNSTVSQSEKKRVFVYLCRSKWWVLPRPSKSADMSMTRVLSGGEDVKLQERTPFLDLIWKTQRTGPHSVFRVRVLPKCLSRSFKETNWYMDQLSDRRNNLFKSIYLWHANVLLLIETICIWQYYVSCLVVSIYCICIKVRQKFPNMS